MPKFKLREYSPADFYSMKFKDRNEIDNILAVKSDFFENLYIYCKDLGFTVCRGDEIVCFLFGFKSYLGFIDVMLFSSKTFPEVFDKELLREIKKSISLAQAQTSRLQTVCSASDCEIGITNRRFLEFMGFKQECLMRKYGFNNEDKYLYSLVKED